MTTERRAVARAAPAGRYHHGDLRQALLRAAEDELGANGIEGFSLRAVAKRAGVSHAAPAHHFRDVGALLTALAAEGFNRLVAAQEKRQAQAGAGAQKQLVAIGLGYVDFALANPSLFHLMFGSCRADHNDPALEAAAQGAYRKLTDAVAALRASQGARAPGNAGNGALDATAAWAMVHGLAQLMISGHVSWPIDLPEDQRDAVLAGMIERSIPQV